MKKNYFIISSVILLVTFPVSAEIFKYRDASLSEKIDFRINASGLWHAKIGWIEKFNDFGVDIEKQIPKKLDFGILGNVDVGNENCEWSVKIFPEPNMSDNEMFGGLVKCRNKKSFKFIAWKDEVADAYFPVNKGVMRIRYTKKPDYKSNEDIGESW